MISDPTVVFNSLPDDSLSSDSSSSSPPEETGPTLSQEAGPTLSQEVGPTTLQGAHSAALDSSRPVFLSQSMSSFVDTLLLTDHDNNNWSHLPLIYAHASTSIKQYYDHIGRVFTERGSTNQYAIVDIVTSSAPKFQSQICFKFYDTSIFPSPPSLDDLYEYEEISSFLSDSTYQVLSKPFLYLKRRLNQFKACKAKALPNIPLSISQARQHAYATEFMAALDDELLSLRTMDCYRHYFGDASNIPKGRLINSKIIFDIVYNPDGTFKSLKLVYLLEVISYNKLTLITLLQL